jgi:5-amino-6-(5-phosphoribosylamino)uracil reductase
VDRPYVLLSCAMSLDGYIDDASAVRLVLSGAADLDRVDEVRAGSDAILVGAGTIRADNPRLLLHSQARREARIAAGVAPDPAKITVTATGDLDPEARFFSAGESARIVYVASGALQAASRRLGDRAEVVDAGDPVDLVAVLADLADRGVKRLMVEGGSSTITQFLTRGLADELQLAIAPLFVGDSRAPRFAGDGNFPWNSGHRAKLARVSQVGDDAVLTFALSDRFGE